jgi:subtilisin family serine protease
MVSWIELEQARRALIEGNGSNVKIAVIDSGIETSHPEFGHFQLADDLAIVADENKLRVVTSEGCDVFGHGTAVAHVLRTLAPKVEIGSFRVLGHDNSSRTTIICRAAQEAFDRGYQILNCSFGCGVESHVVEYKAWVDEAYLKGVHVVAACNNEDFNTPMWPAYFPSVIAVNMARTDEETEFYHRRGTLVEFAAKGVDVRVPWVGGGEKVVTGSSFAAPRLAALLARLLSVYPHLTPLEAKAILQKLAIPWSERVEATNVMYM